MTDLIPASVDILVRHAYVITMDDDGRLIPDGAVAILGRRIVDVGADEAVANRVQALRTIDARGAPVHPGLVETHLHASYQTFRGVVPGQIREVDVFPTIERHFYEVVTDEEEYLGCLLSCLEMVRTGRRASSNPEPCRRPPPLPRLPSESASVRSSATP